MAESSAGLPKRIIGGILIASGVFLVGWIIFSIAMGINHVGAALPGSAFAGALIYVGSNWVRGQVAR